MFKPHYGTCIQCDKEGIIVVKKGYCHRCNHDLKQDKKKSEGKSVAKKQTFKATGEKDVFNVILDSFEDNPVNCFVCGKRLTLITHSNFAHILRKGKYERFRLNPDNIRVMCHNIIADEKGNHGCHYSWDFKPRSELAKIEMFDRLFDLETKLKKEYNSKVN